MKHDLSTVFSCVAVVCTVLSVFSTAQQPDTPPSQTVSQPQRDQVQKGPGEPIAGKVLSALDGHPLPHATVTLFRQEAQNKGETTIAGTQTGEDGSFHFDPVPPGRYNLLGQAPGYLTTHLWQHGQFWSAVVIGKGLETTSLDLRLTPEAAITGRLLDGMGDPVAQAQVTLYRSDFTTTAGRVLLLQSATTEDDGRYSFDSLPPGKYFISALGTPWYAIAPEVEAENTNMLYRTAVDPALDVAYPRIFYPHALRSTEASPLDLHAGETITADMQMVAEHAVTLTLSLSTESGSNQPFPQLTALVFGEPQRVPLRLGSMSAGTLRLSGIVPGQYDLLVQSNDLLGPAMHVDLSSGSGTISMPRSQPMVSVSVSVSLHTVNNGPLPANLHAQLFPSLGKSFGQPSLAGKYVAASTGKGVVTFEQVPPGDYRLQVFAENGWIPAISIQVEDRPAPGNTIHVTGNAPLHAQATLVLQHIHMDGFAQQDGKPAAGCLMELVPASGDTSKDLFRFDQSDLDGSFTFLNVVPGNYILLAIRDGWLLPWADVGAMMPYLLHGTPVSVAAEGPIAITLRTSVLTQTR